MIPAPTEPPRVVTALSEGWTLEATAGPGPANFPLGPLPASVPGCVHTDLLAAGLIPDPYLDNNEAALAWIGAVDWTYRRDFTWATDGHDRHDLVCEGVDTVATIRVNGTVVANVANQHRSYRVSLDAILSEGTHSLEVAFKAPVPAANQASLDLGVRPRPYPLPYEAIRKSACNFGWDWGIATFTSGLWKPVFLEAWSVARLADVDLVAEPVGDGGCVRVSVRIERAGSRDVPVRVRVSAAGAHAEATIEPGADAAQVRLDLAHVERWWPVGYGAQPLTEVTVALVDDAELVLDQLARRVGFRTIRWDTTPDAKGTPFALHVNDVPVFVKGANWIPDDALPVRVDRQRLNRRLSQAVEANLNLIRVWGGGLYESDDFYDLCDELGLLTWQDFLFACAAYPEEEPLRSEIAAEARENVRRIGHHASLVLLAGCNENLWGYEDWGWQARLDGKTWGAYYYYDLLPSVVADVAPHVPYVPGSPFSPGGGWDGTRQTGPHPNAEEHGTAHLWEQWNRVDWPTYRDHTPRFVAEFGWQGPPTWTTLTESISDSPLTPESPGMIVHQKAMEGNAKLTQGLVAHLRVPEDMETWHWAMQLNQAVAVRTALEHFRSWAPHTMGAVVWQLNDCWPVTSWAAIDGQERAKPLFYALKRAFAPRIVTVQPRESGLVAALCNDTSERWEGELAVSRLTFAGDTLAAGDIAFDVEPHSTLEVPLPADWVTPRDASREVIALSAGSERGEWYFCEARDSALAPLDVDVVAEPAEGGTLLTLTARTLARDLTVLVDKVSPDAHAHEGLLTLLPGETASVMIRHEGAVDPALWSRRGVLRSTNELVTP